MNRQRHTWEPTDADLLAYALDDLAGARGEYVAAHLTHCQACRQRLANLRRALDQLDSLPVPEDDLHGRALLKSRIQAEAANPTPRFSSSRPQPLRAGLAAAALLLVVAVLAPALTGAGSPRIRRLIGWDADLDPSPAAPAIVAGEGPLPTAGSTVPVRPSIEPSDLPFGALAPETLPGDNELVAVMAYAPGTFEAFYLGADGLELLITQEPATTRGIHFNEAIELQVVRVGDVDAYVLMDQNLESVAQISWVRGGVFFTANALRAAHAALPVEEAIEIVAHLNEMQDNPKARQGT